MNFFEAIETCLTKYATFQGRAPRSEYWWFFLFNLIVSAVARLIPLVGIIIPLAMLLPNIAVSVRRLHDTDRSSWFLLLPAPAVVILIVLAVIAMNGQVPAAGLLATIFGLIALGCWAVLWVWFCQRGTLGPNRYGGDPLAA
jgi:uncharacterized membrane protein YhaH (DUF805 family)